MELSENKRRMQRGELYHAFSPELIEERYRCVRARDRFNSNTEPNRRKGVELWRDLIQNHEPMPPLLADTAADREQFNATDPWVESPINCDYGYNLKIAAGAYVNHHATFIDTCTISIGSRVLVGPNCNFYSGTHPLDPAIRDGLQGPETGKPIWIEDDCWIAGNVTILPGIRVGRGAVVGAGSVVTKDVPSFHLVAGNPARIIRKIESAWDDGSEPAKTATAGGLSSAEEAMAEQAKKAEKVESEVV